MLVKNLSDGTTRTIGNVTEYAFNKKSDHLAYIVESANAAGNSVELFNLQNYYIERCWPATLLKFSKLTWQKEGDGLAFLKTIRKTSMKKTMQSCTLTPNIYKTPVLKIFDPETAKGFPAGMRISNNSAVTYE